MSCCQLKTEGQETEDGRPKKGGDRRLGEDRGEDEEDRKPQETETPNPSLKIPKIKKQQEDLERPNARHL